MIRYDAGILTVQFRPLRALRVVAFAAVLFVGVIFPGTELADDEIRPSPPSWVAKASIVERVLERRTTFNEEERSAIARTVAREAETANLDPLFILAIIEAESGFDHIAVSTWTGKNGVCVANAKGIMQIVDATWKSEVARRGLPRMDRFDPRSNIIIGVGYLSYLTDLGFKRFDAVLTAYVLGPGGAAQVYRGKADEKAVAYAHAYVNRVHTFYTRNLQENGGDPKLAKKSYTTT